MCLQGADPSVWATPRTTVVLPPPPPPVRPSWGTVAREALALPFLLASVLAMLPGAVLYGLACVIRGQA